MAFNIVQHRRGSEEAWERTNVIPADGELIIVEFKNGTKKIKIGDGSTHYKNLVFLDKSLSDKIVIIEEALKALDNFAKGLSGTDDIHAKVLSEIDAELANIKIELANLSVELDKQIEISNNEVLQQAESYTDTQINNLNSATDNKLKLVKADIFGILADLEKLQEQIALDRTDLVAIGSTIQNLQSTDTELRDLIDNTNIAIETVEKASNNLSDEISKTNALVVQSDNRVKQLNNDLEKLTTDTESQYALVNSSIKDLEQKQKDGDSIILAKVEEYANNLTLNVSELAEKHDNAVVAIYSNINTVFSQLNEKIIGIEAQLSPDGSIERRLAAILNDVKVLKDNLNLVTDSINTHNIEFTKINDSVKQNAQDIVKNSQDINTLQQALTTLKKEKIVYLEKNITALNEDITNLSNTLDSTIKDELAIVNADIANIKDSVAENTLDFKNNLESVKSEFADNLIEEKTNLESKIVGLDTRLNTAINDLNNNLTSEISTKVAELDTDFTARLDTHTSELNTKLENNITSIRTELIEELKEDIDNVETDMSTLSSSVWSRVATLDTEISNLSENLNKTIKNNVSKLESTIADINTELSNLDTQLENLENTAVTPEELQASASELRNSINSLSYSMWVNKNSVETAISDITTRVTDLTQDSQQNIEDIIETKAEISANLALIQSLRKNINNIETNLTTVIDKANDLDIQINNKISVDINEALKAISDLEKQLNVLDSRFSVADQELATKLSVQTARLDTHIAASTGDLRPEDDELLDIRIGYDGTTYNSAGEAVRAIGEELSDFKQSLPSYIPDNAVDGLLYENNQLYLTSKGEPICDPVEITGGSGGNATSIVRVVNNLPTISFTVSKGTDAWIDFTYTSFEDGVSTGDGFCSITVNDTIIEAISGAVAHGVAKRENVAEYLKNGSNTVKVTCSDQYGVSRNLVYTISVIELSIESTFNNTQIFNDVITFRYKVFGQIDKTAHILVDDTEISTRLIRASISGNEITLLIPKQLHGSHKITAYATATIGDTEIFSNILEYEIICIEETNKTPIIVSKYNLTEATQGDLISIPYMVYDPVRIDCNVDLTVYAQVAGELIVIDKAVAVVNREQRFWNTRKCPAGVVVFEVSYTYTLNGDQSTICKKHTINVSEFELDIFPEEDSLQLYLTAQNQPRDEQNPNIWEFTQAPNGEITYDTITTTFSGFNWKSNGWVKDAKGDTCLRLNGDARAIINFKPFAEDFKLNGKTLEFEFAVRDVNDRNAVVINCFDGMRGFMATPDKAFLKSSGTETSCQYKDEERIRVAVTVEHSETASKFVSIYLDGILSGIQSYAATDIFSQDNPLAITLGSNLCGLDIYNIRIYSKALSATAILNNYIADQVETTTKQQLATNNDILDENGNISYDRVKALGQIPIITFTGPMPTYKGDKKNKTTYMKFEDPAHPEMNFNVLLDQIDVQGTSSQFYVRKNWKVKLPEARAHMPGAIPAKVFCIKVDYAEATGTHNTGAANFIETLYYRDKVTLPPQKDDTRVRTTIQGFPIIIFEKETEDSVPVFSSKGNFNYDKDAENAFGFTEYYSDYGVECWEFCNNTSNPVNFVGEITNDWLEDFEPRYVPKSANFDRIEELKEIEELAAKGQGTMTTAQRTELSTLMSSCIANFKEMHDWVLSTATYTLVNNKKVDIVPVALDTPITYGDTTYTEDNKEFRLAKFKYEFENYFNMHYCVMYYVFSFFALMTDQRAKNLFLTRWKDEDGIHRWYPYFYDNDTIFGINNEGALVFDYYHEDTDQLGSSNVFNGQNSVLWHNFSLCFPGKIAEAYAQLRSDKKLTYDTIINQFVTEGSDKWSAAIYNADAEYKYVSMARGQVDHTDADGNQVTGIDTSNLYQVRGPGEHHLRYFIDNRINYCDSKWAAGDYPSNFFFLRVYSPSTIIPPDTPDSELANFSDEQVRIYKSLKAVPACPNITVTPFSAGYAGVRYKSGILQQQRLNAGETYEFTPINPDETFSDTETAIYGASELSSLGDLSGLYCGVVNLAGKNTTDTNATQGNVKENKLVELIIGNAHTDYYNDNFREIAVGTCKLLKTIDLRNCSGLGIAGKNPQKTLILSGCPNIEHIYTEGTNLASIELPESGYIKTLHLPASINTLTIKNQQNITDFSIESYSNIKTLCIENSSLNTNEILDACRDAAGKFTVERVRLTGIEWGTAEAPLENADFIKSLFPVYDEAGKLISGIRGIDEKNNPLDDAYIVGTCHIKKLTGVEYNEIKSHYPYLEIAYDELTSEVIFMDAPGGNILRRETIIGYNSEAPSCEDPVEKGWIEKPVKETTDKYNFEWAGWTRDFSDQIEEILSGTEAPDVAFIGIPHKDALQNITGTRVLYPAFEGCHRSYTVHFVNANKSGDIELQTCDVLYGRDAVYTGAEPQKQNIANPEFYQHTGWLPEPVDIVEELTCYAQFAILDDLWYTLDLAAISGLTDSNGNTIIGYTLNEGNSTIAILDVNRIINENPAVRIPQNMEINGKSYAVTSIDGFDNHNKLALLDIQEGLLTIDSGAFDCCSKLYELNLPESLTTIKSRAFGSCTSLKTLYIPANVSTIQDEAFAQCSGLTEIKVAESNKNFKVDSGCLIKINDETKHLIQGINTATIPDYVKTLGNYCFANTTITEITIPENISIISNNAFSRCENLVKVVLPNTVKTLDATCFAWCKKLSVINLPEGLTHIMTYIFAECALENILIPSTVQKISEMAFGAITTLKTVTFSYNKDTDLQLSEIHAGAFRGAGHADGIVFNVPWSEQDAIDDMNNGCKIGIGYGCAAYKDFKKDEYVETIAGPKQKYPLSSWYWGATGNVTINYNYKEEA